jgi:hypothetical protein
MSIARRNRSGPVTALMLAAMALVPATGRAQVSEALGGLPEKWGGLPANAPQRPATPYATPNVYEVRPTRPVKALTADEQRKLEAELTALRESQKNRANPKLAAPKAPAPKKGAGPASAPLNLAKPTALPKPAPAVRSASPAKPAPVAKKTSAPPRAAPGKKEAAKPEIVPDARQPAGPMRLIN